MTKMTGTEAINQGVYGFYLAERARELAAELDALTPPGCTSLDGMALAAWAGRASVTLSLIAEEFAGPLPVPGWTWVRCENAEHGTVGMLHGQQDDCQYPHLAGPDEVARINA